MRSILAGEVLLPPCRHAARVYRLRRPARCGILPPTPRDRSTRSAEAMTGTNPLLIAKECHHLATKAGGEGQAFQKGAMVMMGAMVVASVGGVVLQLWKE